MGKKKPSIELADIVREYGDELRRAHQLSPAQEKVLWHIDVCRTSVLGGHVDVCDSCVYERISYNSCRDRHCPKCQSTRQVQWLEERVKRLLPVPYFHLVFTLPSELNALTLGNKKLIYDMLFYAASRTLTEIAADPKHLGAQLGFTAVLHTWGQTMQFHPHLHCIVTGGGLTKDGSKWIRGRQDYLLPVKALGKLFRGKFLAILEKVWQKDLLRFDGSTTDLAHPVPWSSFRDSLYRKNWVVYAKKPFGGPEHVYRYLSGYTHRIAMSNHRIVSLEEGQVSFNYKDYKASKGAKQAPCKKLMTLDAVEFLRRFLLHVLPKSFMRIRHFGIMASANVSTKLVTAKRLLSPHEAAHPSPYMAEVNTPWWESFLARTGVDVMACPHCKKGRLTRTRRLLPNPSSLFPRGELIQACGRSP